MATINGHARPIAGLPAGINRADHTNVSCSGVPGRLWVCCGVAPAGPIICSGEGSSKSADCFSKPTMGAFNLIDTAGILYLITGVCHQASNRILFSAGVLINNMCRGYGVSVAAFGPFGIPSQVISVRLQLKGKFLQNAALKLMIRRKLVADWITKVNSCLNIQGDLVECSPTSAFSQPPLPPISPEMLLLNKHTHLLYKKNLHWSEEDLFFESTKYLLTQGMSSNEQIEFEQPILELMNNYISVHTDNTANFLGSSINTQEFIDVTDGNALGLQEQIAGLLGPDQFKKSLWTETNELYHIADPNIALETYGDAFDINNFIQ